MPEIASRRHLELVVPVVREALDEAGRGARRRRRVAVTQGPGLIGALLVGLSAAKALAWARGLPLVPGRPPARATSPRSTSSRTRSSRRSSACSRAAGTRMLLDVRERGSFEVLGSTLDDAAGEAFDKGARLLGLGYPGGAAIDRLAREGDPEAYAFPVARVPGLDFSFSGLKTALLYAVRDLGEAELERRRADLAASYQRAIVRALVGRLRGAAADGRDPSRVVGGVAANSELRAALPGRRVRAARALHRQRGDDRLRGPLRRAPSRTRTILASMPLRSVSGALRRVTRARGGRRRGAALAVSAGGGDAGASLAPAAPAAAAWQGLLGEPRPDVALGQRSIVVLELAVARRPGRRAGGRRERPPGAQVVAAGARGAAARSSRASASRARRSSPSSQYTRVLNGFSAALDPRAIALLERATEVEGVYPVRAAYPAAISSRVLARRRSAPAWAAARRRAPRLRRPRRDDRAARHRRRPRAAVPARPRPGGHRHRRRGRSALAAPKPDGAGRARAARHASSRGSSSARRAGGLRGRRARAPRSLPIRVAGWQRDAAGRWAVYSRTDQMIAGLERAVDPNGDGDAHDAARDRAGRRRRAVRGVRRRAARARGGGRARSSTRSSSRPPATTARPGRATAASPGRAARRRRSRSARPTSARAAREARVVVRDGLERVLDRRRAARRRRRAATRRSPPASRRRALAGRAAQARGLELADFFDSAASAASPGRAALVPAGGDTAGAVRAAAAGGRAPRSLVYGGAAARRRARARRARAGAGRRGPARRSPRAAAARARGGERRRLDRAGAARVERPPAGGCAAFSSRGLAFDGRVKPELAAPGVGRRDERAGRERGRLAARTARSTARARRRRSSRAPRRCSPRRAPSSAPATLQERPRRLARGRSRTTSVTAQGAGLVDVGRRGGGRARRRSRATLALRARRGPATGARERVVLVRNLSPRTLRVARPRARGRASRPQTRRCGAPAALICSARRHRARPRRRRPCPRRPAAARPPRARSCSRPSADAPLRVPFAIALRARERHAAARRRRALRSASLPPSDTRPAVLRSAPAACARVGGADEVAAGRAASTSSSGRAAAAGVGVIARLRDLLPGPLRVRHHRPRPGRPGASTPASTGSASSRARRRRAAPRRRSRARSASSSHRSRPSERRSVGCDDGRSARHRTSARTRTRSPSSSSGEVADGLRRSTRTSSACCPVQEGRDGLDPDADGRRHRSRSSPATASRTTSRAARRRAASATTRTSRSTRSRRSRCG